MKSGAKPKAGRARRTVLKTIGGAAALAGAPAIVRGQSTSGPIKVGWAISKTGPFSGGAGISQWPNYELWIKDVNAAGGINVGGRKRLLEAVQYDDRSQSEEGVRAFERLVNEDRVDIMLPPWGTGMNLAVAPIFHRAGYPMMTPTLISDRVPEIVKRWNNVFVFLNTAAVYAEAAVEQLKALRDAGRINDTIALAHVADQFGLELANAARKAAKVANFRIVSDQGYPGSTQDLSTIVAEAQRSNPDTFLAFSYPPDTMKLTDASRVRGFNPKVFYTAVGTAFPLFRQTFKDNVEGVMGIGGWNPGTPPMQDYIKRHVAMHNREPDRWVSSICYASLQVLQKAIEKVGSLDRSATVEAIRTGTFDTILGPTRLVDNIRQGGWYVGQWQDGDFVGVGPAQPGAKPVRFPKPGWKTA